MDKNLLKKFAIESRQELMEKMKSKINTFFIEEEFKKEQRGDLYVLSNEKHSLTLSKEEYDKRESLINRINELTLEQVVEESAYTWFNRIIAIRYMEIQDYLPLTKDNQSLGVRVLSSKDNTPDPEILKFTNLSNPELDIGFKKDKYAELQDDNEKFKYILLLVCKKLGKVIPQVFDGITDYIDILVPDNLLNDSGFVTKVIKEIPEDNYSEVEIIGWLYQYYNQTEKDKIMSTKKAYKKNEIPYVTQLFTPDWIVRYMVENSLGRFWIEHGGDKLLIRNWHYYINSNSLEVKTRINPIEIKCIDPCSGSGHILVYMFEILFQIYESYGYSKKDIAELIIKNNLYGLDIDDRAWQLSVLSVLLKAREFDKDIFNKDIAKNLNVLSIQETNGINLNIANDLLKEEEFQYLLDSFKNAKEIGSLLYTEEKDYSKIINRLEEINIYNYEIKAKVISLVKQANILCKKYDIVIMNPPYMPYSRMSDTIKDYLKTNYSDSKYDLCTAFMENRLMKNDCYLAMINMQSWMFLSGFEDLRKKLLETKSISSMIHLGAHAFEEIGGEVVQTTTFVMNEKNNCKDSIFFRLSDYDKADIKEKEYLNSLKKVNDSCFDKNKKITNVYYCNFEGLKKIPGKTVAYWASDKILDSFENELLESKVLFRQGMATSDNNRFLRFWFEVDNNRESFNCTSTEDSVVSGKKWFAYNKGGEYRKWYGNIEYVVNWEHDGKEMKDYTATLPQGMNVRLKSREYYFKPCFSWSKISSVRTSFRYYPKGFIFDVAGCCAFEYGENLFYYLAITNSKVVDKILEFLSPTLNFELDHLKKIPIIVDDNNRDRINELVKNNINISKEDWDSFETSWDFIKHPLIEYKEGSGFGNDISKWNYRIKDAYNSWERNCDAKFELLKKNEEELNRLFINIYGLKDELTSEVEDKDITIRKADLQREIKSLISYAVGCMFGRFSLDKEGLVFAGGNFNEVYKTKIIANKDTSIITSGAFYKNDDATNTYLSLEKDGEWINVSYLPDLDNIIPITDEAYFGDDIVARFKQFIEVAFGKETLNENIDFIAETLGKKGTETSEDTIRRYFLNDFFNDHVKMYQKRPIYWLFDSGKKNGFKALVYMHRYNENLIPKVRLDYLHKIQTTYEKLLTDINDRLKHDLSTQEKRQAQGKQADLNAKLIEIKEYDEKIAHIANMKKEDLKIDLDDGVRENYKKFRDILANSKEIIGKEKDN